MTDQLTRPIFRNEVDENCHLCQLDDRYVQATAYALDGSYYCDTCKPTTGDLMQCAECHDWFWDGNFMVNSDGETVCMFCA